MGRIWSGFLRVFKLSLSALIVLLIDNLRLGVVPRETDRCVLVCVVLLQHDVGIILKVVEVLVLHGQRTGRDLSGGDAGNGSSHKAHRDQKLCGGQVDEN